MRIYIRRLDNDNTVTWTIGGNGNNLLATGTTTSAASINIAVQTARTFIFAATPSIWYEV
jgi:hypothetical protein